MNKKTIYCHEPDIDENNKTVPFDQDIDECEDIDFIEGYGLDSNDKDDDIIPDYFLTDNAYEILEELQNKYDKEERKTTVWILMVLALILTAIVLFSFRHIIWD